MSEAKLREELAAAGQKMRDLAKAKNERIRALEAEVERLKARVTFFEQDIRMRCSFCRLHIDGTLCATHDGGGRESGGKDG